MQGFVRTIAPIALVGCLVGLSGCAETLDNIDYAVTSPWRKTTKVANVSTPAKRIEDLKKLADSAKRKSAKEQERIAGELAKQIQYESHPAVRRQIHRTLAAYPTPMAQAVLTAGLQDSDSDVRVIACQSLGQQGGPAAVAELARAVSSDTNTDVRVAAVRALGETGDQAAIAPLADILSDPDPALQFRAKESLRTVSGRDYGDDVDAWQQYAKHGETGAREIGIADRVRRYFR